MAFSPRCPQYLCNEDFYSQGVLWRTSENRRQAWKSNLRGAQSTLGEAKNGLAASFFFLPNPSHSPLR